ncbi:hypothetical protein BDF20DRAFT_838309 [Mycotypha africana]|uniref:uncharacterized protein n=1 Tax=Mycotypha africana TaxID=64632 RepID=UPI0023000A9E|nr:uncharacterized protein BDF20DRAFT_838309 [Mycotypha africana]KAI8972042.1 hypothetical protein BDF20DRAFT_838309 [Mycotypha africana]
MHFEDVKAMERHFYTSHQELFSNPALASPQQQSSSTRQKGARNFDVTNALYLLQRSILQQKWKLSLEDHHISSCWKYVVRIRTIAIVAFVYEKVLRQTTLYSIL